MKTSDFDYDLPEKFIAQTPIEPRDAARLLVLNRETDITEHGYFRDLGDFLNPDDLLILNKTRVIPARLHGRKAGTGGRIEILLLRRQGEALWEALIGGKRMGTGKRMEFDRGLKAEIIHVLNGARRLVRFSEALGPYLETIGEMPLPPYIHRPLDNPERYQTVYAQSLGSAASPTAGLHFTPTLMKKLKKKGIKFASVILHVGLDTFAPVREENPEDHVIHSEWCQVLPETIEAIRQTKRSGGRIVAVGTTSVRSIESAAQAADKNEIVVPFEGATSLFILPGYTFKVVDVMITNFHLPRSTLLMMLSAFAGSERIFATYELAKRENYRFYSFGDAMMIV
ncbi:MAG: tRNA preQ1(34) S-adenosylmethionine ribosyltransferase-isomerase QueA [Chloroflexi bacterium]|nr:tRNA preQ1(34) S-adenosylmethionine ribosyltransferase-isomerase QueA [Chloroflexota bacterium]